VAARIRLLGRPAILDDAGGARAVRGHQAWALLARILLADRPLERRTLAAELFADADDPLGSLRWCLAALRKALDTSDVLIGDPIDPRLPPDVEIDLVRLKGAALPVEEMAPLLDGVEPRCSPEFATWLLVERARIATLIDGRIRHETVHALAVNDHQRAVRLAEMAVGRDVYDESAHVFLVKGLALGARQNADPSRNRRTRRRCARRGDRIAPAGRRRRPDGR